MYVVGGFIALIPFVGIIGWIMRIMYLGVWIVQFMVFAGLPSMMLIGGGYYACPYFTDSWIGSVVAWLLVVFVPINWDKIIAG